MSEPIVLVVASEGARTPEYRSAGAAGADLRACIAEPILLGPGERRAIPTGISLEIEEGHEGQIRPRSGLALEHGLTCLNSPGTIDADYRGEIMVIMINLGKEAVTISRGDRIAQLVVAPVARAEFRTVVALGDTLRGAEGFGSTGLR